MRTSRFTVAAPLRHVVFGATAVTFAVGCFFAVSWAFAHTLASNSDAIQASEFAATLSPGDPRARFRYAFDLEKTFDPEAITRSLKEYETAVAASPHNFSYWLGLGQARERAGDRPAAEAAYRRALELAPNYARTKWALGNNLVRQGRTDEGVQLIRGAVDQDPAFAAPAVVAAMQAFDGDVLRATEILGPSPIARAELAKYLVNAGRFDEGVAVWTSAQFDMSIAKIQETGIAIRGKLVEAKRFHDAAQITGSIQPDESKRPAVGAMTNGGFETWVASQNADFFDWQIGQPYPIYGLSESQPKEGRYSLLVRFTSASKLEMATISRTVALEPDTSYQLSFAYRSDLTSRAEFRWEVLSAADSTRIAIGEPLANKSDWAEVGIRFSVPANCDGITIRLVREKCDSAACTVSGNLWFDDFRLNRS
ncbi:MAG: tetratricopeptide repeat protein [bacterium]|nr:tetratricopeptide repeat protein [bacterium]